MKFTIACLLTLQMLTDDGRRRTPTHSSRSPEKLCPKYTCTTIFSYLYIHIFLFTYFWIQHDKFWRLSVRCFSPVMTLTSQAKYSSQTFPCCSASALCSTRNATFGISKRRRLSRWFWNHQKYFSIRAILRLNDLNHLNSISHMSHGFEFSKHWGL